MLAIFFLCLIVLSAVTASIPEDGRLNFTQLAWKYGHRSEEFDVTTEDGYILKLFHITGNEPTKPVFLMHGILDSADTYLLRGKKSIAVNLAEAGYDVWVGNVRGNKYSRRHVKLNPDKNKKKFWNFSLNEMGMYDLPASIDFILNKTGQKKLAAIGHSQGTSSFYVLGSTRPEYNKKISVFISLAPIAYLNDVGPVVAGMMKMWPLISGFFERLGYEGVLEDHSAANQLMQFICSQKELGYDVCGKLGLGAIAGEDSEELEREFFDVVLGHYPAGTSRKAFAHFTQIHNNARFAPYDYGIVKNLFVYKSAAPPAYNLSKATMPIVLLAATNDMLSGIRDVQRLKRELPNVVHYHVMERKEFNHVDYIWGKNIDVYMTPLLRDLLRKFA
ncbi:hypothetical protein ABMA27_016854 [Loxostege sticticalis]|uniref:Lipase n=1 Tax=Loxostege sticticalis TaxID=481309 RepID=A0ABR3I3U4_LOXSC